MAAPTKFRSLKAFSTYSADEEPESLSPVRVLSLLKEAGGLPKRELARRLQASTTALEGALVQLVKQNAVTVRATEDDDLIVP